MNIYILLDQSGSMATRWSETVNALNSYLSTVRGKKGFKKAVVNVAAFDSDYNLRFVTLRRGESLNDVKPLASHEASPSGMTPLYDAIGAIGRWISQDNPKKAAVLIYTDGAENASRELKGDDVKKLTEAWEKLNYDVNFIGADFDPSKDAANIGLSMNMTLQASGGNYLSATQALASKSMLYGATGARRAFTTAERKAAVGDNS